MLVINVFYKLKPGKREDFLEMIEKEGIRTGSLEEEGNVTYRYFRAIADEDELFLYEEWRDVDAHALHRTMPHYLTLQERQGEFIEDLKVNKYITE